MNNERYLAFGRRSFERENERTAPRQTLEQKSLYRRRRERVGGGKASRNCKIGIFGLIVGKM